MNVAAQDAVLDERRALRRRTFVVDVQRAAPPIEGAVIDHRDIVCGDFLANAIREGRCALAVEITFQSMANRLVQQDTRPARTQHDRHGARRRGHGVQIDQRLAHRFAPMLERGIALQQLIESEAAAAAAIALLAPAVLFHDDRDVDAHQGTHIRRQHAVARGDQHDLMHRGQGGHHLLDAGIETAGIGVDAHQPGHFVLVFNGIERIERQIETMGQGPLPGLHAIFSAAACNRARGV